MKLYEKIYFDKYIKYLQAERNGIKIAVAEKKIN